MPDRYNAGHQRYCGEPACQKASHEASQRRWLARPENRTYHGNGDHCKRVRIWRQEHPAGWRERAGVLQDFVLAQPIERQPVAADLGVPPAPPDVALPGPVLPAFVEISDNPCRLAVAPERPQDPPLQDFDLAQAPLFVGLIASLVDPLQDDIGLFLARLQTRGQAILRRGPGMALKGTSNHDPTQTGVV